MEKITGTCWSITINNPTETDRQAISTPPEWVGTIAGQEEIGKEGTLHYQGMIKAKYTIPLKRVKEYLPRAHIEKARNVKALEQYVKKSDTAVEGTYTESSGGATKTYITPSRYPRLICETLVNLLGESPIVISGEQYTIDTIRSNWAECNELIHDRVAQYLVQEGWHIELLAIDKKMRQAWYIFGLALLREAGMLPKKDPHSNQEITEE